MVIAFHFQIATYLYLYSNYFNVTSPQFVFLHKFPFQFCHIYLQYSCERERERERERDGYCYEDGISDSASSPLSLILFFDLQYYFEYRFNKPVLFLDYLALLGCSEKA
ncbi:hypothetical protein VNO77_06133 [Canavalia gladiata]|uniref:Uncharacterized protein n=1 Tax=Canavalia gladiata TaxID=3824 RepID=A0AAN9QSS1_CANGL